MKDHDGKSLAYVGQQGVVVEHVNVAAGGQAIVGNVKAGGGVPPKSKDQPHAIAHAPSIAMPSTDTSRMRLPVAGDEKCSVPDAGQPVAGGAEGK